jgi:hypothetical protein
VLIAKLSERSHHFEELGRAIGDISLHAPAAALRSLERYDHVRASGVSSHDRVGRIPTAPEFPRISNIIVPRMIDVGGRQIA